MVRKVAVIMGSDSDWPVVKGACAQLKALDIPFEAHILSAHRTPAEAAAFAKGAKENGFGVILCAAGMAAHLAGAFAANTTLPVIGIPMKGGAMDGLDALLATVAREGISMCGAAPLALAFYALHAWSPDAAVRATLVMHETSAAVSHDSGHVVGYAGLRIFSC